MGNSEKWLKARNRHIQLIRKSKKIATGGLIAALIVGPLIYFGAIAVPIELNRAGQPEGLISEEAATPEVAIEFAATPEIQISETPIEFPKQKEPLEKIQNPKVEFDTKDLPAESQLTEIQVRGNSITPEETLIETLKSQFIEGDDFKIKQTKRQTGDGRETSLFVMQNLNIKDGPQEVKQKTDAENVAMGALRKYLKTRQDEQDFSILKGSAKLKNSQKPLQLVIDSVKEHDGKWYVVFQQYKEALPVFDGSIKLIFTDQKQLIAITDNIRNDLPDPQSFVITQTSAEENVKKVFEWDETKDTIEFTNKGYYKNKISYKVELKSHNPLGDYEVFVGGDNGKIENVTGNIRLADERDPTGGFPDIVDEYILPVDQPNPRSELFEKIIAPVYAEETVELPTIKITSASGEILSESPAVPEFNATPDIAASPEIAGTLEPSIIILDAFYSQVLGKIYPQNPNQNAIIEPLSDAYVYKNNKQITTDEDGFFENNELDWYSTFLDGPYVIVYDDDASSNVEIKDNSPEDPFVWDENSASLAAINAFYHTNKLHEYFAEIQNYDLNKKIPVTVNSELVDQYLNGCGAWFDNTNKEIEIGRGGTDACPEDLNYALSSDFIYHEYAHFVVEEITHLPNITGSEAAAMGEGLADYFAASVNNDSVWGDVVAPNNTRNLKNTLNYNTDFSGRSHSDGQIFAGALWDLRILIGPNETDRLVFNTLYQDRLHFETFMYGMLIEDDDNNDFSDGTPHMLEIIAAFQNHGIGPGIENFDGLPIDPEAWTDLLGEETPEGEEDPLYQGITGAGCHVTGTTLNIYSGTCTVSGYESTYTDVNVYSDGTLEIGSTTGTSTLVITNLYVYGGSPGGIVNIGGSTYRSSYITMTGSLILYDASSGYGGRLYTINNASYSNAINGYPTVTIEGSLAQKGQMILQDNATNLLGNTNVYGIFNVGFFTASSATISGTLWVYSGATVGSLSSSTLTVNYVNVGNSTTAGGALSITGTFTVYYNLEVGDGGSFANNGTSYLNTNTSASALYYTTLRDGSTFTNGSGRTLYIEGRLHMYDDSSLTNNGNLYVEESVYTQESATTLSPTLTNNGLFKIQANYRGEGIMDLRNETTFNNNSTGTVQVHRYLRLGMGTGQKTTFNNDGIVYIGWDGSTTWGTSTDNLLGVFYDSEFFNNSGSTLIIDRNATTNGDGQLQLKSGINSTSNSPRFINTGTIRIASMLVGTSDAASYSALFTNNAGGDMNTFYSGTSFPSLDINYGGTVTNAATVNDDFVIAGNLNMDGDATRVATLTNQGDFRVYGSLNLENYSYFDNYGTDAYAEVLGSVWQTDASEITNDTSLTHYDSDLIIGSSGSQGDLHVRDNSTFTNYGNVTVYDDIFTGGDISNTAAILTYDSFLATSSADNEMWITGDATFLNYDGEVNISYSSGNDADGIIHIYNNAVLTNRGTNGSTIGYLKSQKLLVGIYDGSPIIGGELRNKNYGTVQVSSSDTVDAIDIYKGTLWNGYQPESSWTSSTLTVTNGGIRVIAPDSFEESYFKNYGSAAATNIYVYNYGNAEIKKGTFSATGCYIYGSDATTSPEEGYMLVGAESSATANTTATCTNVYLGTDSIVPGELRVQGYGVYDGILYGTNAYIREDTNYPNSTVEVSTSSNGVIDFSGGDFFLGTTSYFGGQVENDGDFTADNLELWGNANFTNDGTVTTTTKIDLVGEGTAVTQFDNNAAVYGSNLNISDTYAYYYNNGTATSDYSTSVFMNGGYIGNSGTFDVGDITSVLYNTIEADYATLSNTGGDFTTDRLHIGNTVSDAGGGKVYNDNDGVITVTGTGSDAMYVQKNSGNFTDSGLENRLGDLSVAGQLTMDAPNAIAPLDVRNGYTGIPSINDATITVSNPAWQQGYSTIANYGSTSFAALTMQDPVTNGNRYFNNYGIASGGTHAVHTASTFENKSTGTVDLTGDLQVYDTSGTFNNYGNTQVDQIMVGQVASTTGGVLNNYSGGDIESQSTDPNYSLQVYNGTFNQQGGAADTVTVSGGMILAGPAAASNGLYNSSSGAGLTNVVGNINISTNGYMRVQGSTIDAGVDAASVTINGANSSNRGTLEINGAEFEISGILNVNDYGYLINEAINFSPTQGALRVSGVTSVSANGEIASDDTSLFYLVGGFETAGTVAIDDDITAPYITMTAGTTTLGLETNVGKSSISGLINITDGTFTTYNIGDNAGVGGYRDIKVDGASSTLVFANDDGTSGTTCYSDIYGSLDIVDDAIVYINCETKPAVKVHADSPSGTTLVEGILFINTNLETDDMIVGDGTAGEAGLVTHDIVNYTTPSGWQPNPEDVFVLTVLNTLTLKASSMMNVDGRVAIEPVSGTGNRGGSYGGYGQFQGGTGTATPVYGAADVPYTASPRTIEEFGICGMDSGGTRCSGGGGGIMHIETGNFTIETNGLVTASGSSTSIGGGSGGTINITTHGNISGGGFIRANGGASTTTTGFDTAGGGGRIYVEYWDDSSFLVGSPDFTGVISAIGGAGAINGAYGGTGTITKRWANYWGNQKDGTIIIDPFGGTSTYPIDVYGDGTGTVNLYDRTPIVPAINPGIESFQAENGALVYFDNGGSSTKLQQCLNDGSANISYNGALIYNREHTNAAASACISTPDPAGTLYINNSGTGAQSAYPGEEDDTRPHIQDITPDASAIYYDGMFDSDGYTPDGPNGTDLLQYQLQIATDAQSLFETDSTIVTNCDLNDQTIADTNHGTRTVDINIPYSCGQNLTTGTNYYWRIRFLENTGATDYWGLWSETNTFKLDEAGTLDLISCGGTFSGKFDIGTYDSSTGDNYDSDYCNFTTDATVGMYIKASKNQKMTNSVDSTVTIWDMFSTDYDPPDATGGLDGETNTAGDYDNEVGFHLLASSINTPPFQVQISPAATYYHMNYTFLPNSPTTIMTSTTGYSNESFIMYLAAYIHGLIPNPTDPIANAPTGTCGYTSGGGTETHDTCTTPSGTYSATVTLTASTSP